MITSRRSREAPAPLSPAEVVGWFREAAPNWPVPTEAQAAAFFSEVTWLMRPHKAARVDPARQKRVADALLVLGRDLPAMIGGGDLVADEIDHAEALLAAARWLADNRGPTLKPEVPWHPAARSLARRAVTAWGAAGHPGASHQTEGGPVVHVVAMALHRAIGKAPPHATIAKTLQRSPLM